MNSGEKTFKWPKGTSDSSALREGERKLKRAVKEYEVVLLQVVDSDQAGQWKKFLGSGESASRPGDDHWTLVTKSVVSAILGATVYLTVRVLAQVWRDTMRAPGREVAFMATRDGLCFKVRDQE